MENYKLNKMEKYANSSLSCFSNSRIPKIKNDTCYSFLKYVFILGLVILVFRKVFSIIIWIFIVNLQCKVVSSRFWRWCGQQSGNVSKATDNSWDKTENAIQKKTRFSNHFKRKKCSVKPIITYNRLSIDKVRKWVIFSLSSVV
jgi:hypothetical protein